jgi:hypothetical protein
VAPASTVADLTAPGTPFEMVQAEVNGVPMRRFKGAGDNLSEILESASWRKRPETRSIAVVMAECFPSCCPDGIMPPCC